MRKCHERSGPIDFWPRGVVCELDLGHLGDHAAFTARFKEDWYKWPQSGVNFGDMVIFIDSLREKDEEELRGGYDVQTAANLLNSRWKRR